MRTRKTWTDYYFVRTHDLAVALREARAMASRDHPDTPTDAMMTPHIQDIDGAGIRVMVTGRPSSA